MDDLRHGWTNGPTTDFDRECDHCRCRLDCRGALTSNAFTLRFPFSWRPPALAFRDRWVDIQPAYKLHRKIPDGIVPHMGSQWWLPDPRTLSAILEDPNRATWDRYFRRS